MEKRIILFLVIAFGIIFGFDLLMRELGMVPAPPPLDEPGQVPSTGRETFSSEDALPGGPSDSVPPVPNETSDLDSPIPGQGQGQALPEETEDVETPLYRVQFTTRGAHIHSWQLKQYTTQADDHPSPIDLVYPEGQFAGPLSVQVGDPGVTAALNTGTFEVSRDFDRLDEAHPTGHLTLSYRDEARDILLEKAFTFYHDTYLVDVAMTVHGLDDDVEVLLGTNFGVVEWGQGFIGAMGPAWMNGTVLEKAVPDPEIRRSGDIRWAALQDKYFISVMIPQDAQGMFARTEAEYVATAGVAFPVDTQGSRLQFQLYAGPKQFDALQSLGHNLEDTIDFGWFIYGSWAIVKAVAKPLFHVLRFLYDHTQNYGVAIILLTCGIKLLFVPLQYKSYKSMQGMQTIQPKIQALQARLKHDRERLNRELITLYKEHKVNPVGGCLPMVLQMPVFISLFNILYMTVELRQAPFLLWVQDLSIPDPYYVLPVLMGVSMVVQQKIMPTTMDPTQAKMMLLLPVFLTFLFLTFPAGLVMYWLTNNVLTILQQVVTDRFVLRKSAPVPPVPGADGPVDSRARRHDGGGHDDRASRKNKGRPLGVTRGKGKGGTRRP